MRVVTLATVLAVVLSVDAKNLAGTQENVCLNLDDGTFVADSNSCSSFIVCNGGKPVSQKCESGSYFDAKKLYCIPDTKNICPPSECKVSGAYSAHPTKCYLFYICDAGKLVEQSCGVGSYFDSNNLFCKPDVDNVCWAPTPTTTSPKPCTCVGNYTEGEFVEDPDSCHSYYLCSNGDLVHQTCGFGNYFDSSTKRCARDSTAQCWPQTHPPCTGGLAEGDRVSSSTNCSSYLECTQGELLEQNCPNQYFFDKLTKQCLPDEDGSCWKICECPGGYNQGDLVGSSANCSSYFHCDGGKLILGDCGFGNYFDNNTNNCVRDTNGACWKTDEPCICPGGYKDGEFVENKDNCNSYYICFNGELVAYSCGTGNYFDKKRKICDRDTEGKCWPQCKDGDRFADETSCHKYFECTEGKLVTKDCGDGIYFDSKSKNCVPDDKNICWPRKCPGGLLDGDRVPNDKNCSMYSECTKGDLVQHNCMYGFYFDVSTKQCLRDEDGKCWKICDCPDGSKQGDLVGNSANCSSYYICNEGKLIPGDCGAGNYFDNESKNCVHDDKNICWPRKCPGGLLDGDRVPNDKNCSMYSECTKGDLVQHNCMYGFYFDVSTKQCLRDEDGKCWKICDCPDGSKQGDLVGNSANCSSYYICNEGKLIPGDCGAGNYFDNESKNCVHDDKNICWPRKCPGGLLDGDRVPNDKNCSMYSECTKGDLVQHNCMYGFYFDVSTKQCLPDEDGKCWKICDCPDGSKQGDLVGNSANCSSYFICNEGKLIPGDCGAGNYFDNKSKNCVHDDKNICWPRKCPGGLLDGDRVPNDKNCSMYSECTKGDLVQHNCMYGFYFDVSTKQCLRDEDGKCWKICDCPDGSKQGDLVGNSANCSSYYICNEGKLIPGDCGAGNYFDNKSKNCVHDDKNICWPRKCPGGLLDGDRVPNDKNCSMYSECTKGDLVQHNCMYGFYFDVSTKQCLRDEDGKCWKICDCPDGSKQGDLVGNSANCSSYFICNEGKLIPGDCGAGNYFDNESKNCVHDDKNICWPRKCPGGLLDGDRVPNDKNCSMYSECTKGDLVQHNCMYGFYFDVSTKQCLRDEDGKCWKICDCPDGSKQGDLVGNSANCSSYYICNEGKLIPGDCGVGNYFDNESKNCVQDDKNICWPRKCPGGLLEGDRVPNDKNCSMYSECTKGDIVPHNCMYGFYFDVSTKQCLRDEDGKCWKICDCPDGSKQGDLVGNSANCSSYYICNEGKLIPGDCGAGNYFDNKSKNCVHDDKNICWPRKCPGGLLDGDRVPNDKNCSMYSECTKGDLVQHNCMYGFYFDVSTKQCLRDEDGKCWKICDCPDGSKQGDLVGNSANCSSYYICNEGKLIPGDCGAGNYFDNKSKNCVHDDKNICWPRKCPGGLLDGDRVPNDKNCSMYSECTKGDLVPHNCMYGFYFDVSTKQCLRDEDGKCWSICECPDGSKQGDLVANSANCSSYFICNEGKLIPGDCGFGNYFDTNKCVPDLTGVCWKNDKPCECPGGYKDGDFVAHNTNCYMFYICYGGKLLEESCGYGNYFDAITGSCVLDINEICWKTDITSSSTSSSTSTKKPTTTTKSSTSSSSSTKPSSSTSTTSTKKPKTTTTKSSTTSTTPSSSSSTKPTSTKFTTTKSTSTSSSSSTKKPTTTTKSSTTSTSTETPCTCPGGYENGQFVPHPTKCYLFYMCYNSELVEQSCGYGNYFDALSQSCILDINRICWTNTTSTTKTTTSTTKPSSTTKSTTTKSTTKPSTTTKSTTSSTTTPSTTTESCECPGGYKDGELVAHGSNCSKYFICYNGQLVEEFCGNGNYFDVSTKSCVLDIAGKCWPKSTTTSTSTTTTPRTTTSRSTTTTPRTTTSTTKRSTTTSTTTTPTEPCECPGGYKDGELVAHGSNCSKYFICYNGQLVEEFCGYGNYFDVSTKSCVLDIAGKCWPKSTTTSTSTTTTPRTTTSTSTTTTPRTTTSTTKRSTTTSTTTTPTEPCECPGGYKDGELVAHGSNCSKFFICYNGQLVEEFCGNGNYFDDSTKSCVLDIAGKCWPKSTTTSTSTTTTPRTTTSTSTTTTPRTTTSTTKRSTTTSTTTTPTEPCECLGGYKDGELVAHGSNCSKFFICYNGQLVEEFCGYGNYFDVSTKSCVLDIAGKCWPKSTTTSTSTTTTPRTTTSTSTTTTPRTTTSTTKRSTTTSTTTTPTEPCECPGGYKDGELVAHGSNCSNYFICYNGQLVEEFCGYGNYFDVSTKSCVLDIAGKCWPKSTTTSTSTTTTPRTTTSTSTTTTPRTTTSTTKRSTTTSTTTTPTEPCECPGGYKDGELVAHGSNCSKFFICYNGQLVEEFCGNGNYFDDSTKSCVLDIAGKCWPKSTTTSTSTTTTPRTTTSTSTTTTPRTTTSTTKRSTTTSTTTKPTEPCECPGGYKDGELVAHGSNCSKYFICYNGQLVEEFCGYGNYFDVSTKSCVLDIAGKCWPKSTTTSTSTTTTPRTTTSTSTTTTPRTTTSTTKRSTTTSTTTTPTEPCECPGGYKDGELVAHGSNCSKFFICYNGQLVEEFCGNGNYFDDSTKSCVLDIAGKCWPKSTTTSTSTTTTPRTTTSTSTTTSPRTTTSTTKRSTTTSTTTTPTEPCECPGGYKDGELVAHGSNCSKFFICYNGQLVEEFCGNGNYFDDSTKSCVLDTAGKCWEKSTTTSTTTTTTPRTTTSTSTTTTPRTTTSTTKRSTTTSTTTTPTEPCECPGGYKDGELVAHGSNCSKYFICYNGQLVEEFCGNGNYFDDSTKSCVLDIAGKCWPKSTTTSTSTTTTPRTTTSTSTTTTPRTTTSTTKRSTTTSTTTTPTEPCECPGGYKDGELVAHGSNCSKFFICYNGQLVEEFCGNGNYFDASSKTCVLDITGKCWSKSTTTSTSTTTTPRTTTSTTKRSTTTSTTTTPIEPCECPGGYKDGELVAHGSNCSKYFICYNGQLVEEFCGNGNYFDDSTKSCVLDIAGKCWPKSTTTSTSTTTTPRTTTSTSTTTTPRTTTSTTKRSTTTSTATTPAEPCECPGGYKDGELVAHGSNCSKFFICYNGQLVEEFCGNGNYFDASSKTCVLDITGKCWSKSTTTSTSTTTTPRTTTSTTKRSTTTSTTTPKTTTSTTTPSTTTSTTTTTTSPATPCTCPGGHEEGDFVAHPKNCSSFFICYQGKLSERSCGEGNYFNQTTKSCTLDIDGICWKKPITTTPTPEPCKCPSGLKEGQFIADPESCFKYSICHNGVLIGGNCGTGNIFNNVTNICQPDTAGTCWGKTPPPTTTPCVCPYGLEEGERIDNPESCFMYSTCTQGNLIEGNCGTGNYFNNDTKTCERDTNNCCWPCLDGEMIANIEECDKFSICNDGKFIEQQCGTGYYFDVSAKYCVRDVNGTCWKVGPPTNTCQGAKDGTLLPNPAACEKYFVCQNNKPVAQECGMGNLFNTTTLSCVHDTCGECWTKIPNVCANKPTGTFMRNADHCDQFIVCHENHAIIQQCGSGNWFNPESLLCEQDLYAKCINVCKNTEGTTQLPHPNCNEFYLCQNGLTKAVRTCLKGTNYDAIRGICLASATCEENLCATSPNGVSYPVRNDPSNFYSCYNKKPVKLSCPSGTSFDSERLICMPDTGLCIGQTNGHTIASKKNANAYYVCKDNAAIFEQCPAHTVFDENKRICVHALRKRVANNMCSTESDGTMLSGNACNKFHICLDGESIEQNCGAYASFNPKIGSCVFNATCFNPKEICGISSDIEKFPDARYENSYIACKRGMATMEKCPKDTIYSHDIGSCVPSQMAIKNKELSEMCRQVPDKTITPALDCRKFYICSNRVATLQQCAIDQLFNITSGTCQADTERKCWMRSETLRKSNFLRMIADNDDDYKIVCQECQERHEQKRQPEKKVSFNIPILKSFRSSGCSSEYESLVRESEKSCTEFFQCKDNQWNLKNCPLGKFYNSQLETCTNDSSFCGIQYPKNNSCISNASKPNEMNCGSYFVCFEGQWQHRQCEKGTYFNQTKGKCANADGTCQSNFELQHPCKNGTIMKMNFNSCAEYYLCIDDSWLIKECSNGLYFNETLKACMQADNSSCANEMEQKYVANERKYKITNCTEFEIFLNSEWLTVHCPRGFYFDVLMNKCLVNTGECLMNGLLRQNCTDNTIQPSFNSSLEFYQCLNNEWHLESCMQNFRFDAILKKCVISNNTQDLMKLSKCNNVNYPNLQNGFYLSHETDCTKFYFCEDGIRIEGVCNKGSFFDSKSQRCQNDKKLCDHTYDSICQNKSNGTVHRNPANCSTFFMCINMTMILTDCPQGEYFNAGLGVCQTDISKCAGNLLCDDTNTMQFPHETYCSIYYTCIGGKFIAIACEENYFFDTLLNKCIADIDHLCIDGFWKDSNSTKDVTAVTSTIPDTISCIGRQGDIMPDPRNCNKFYVCINEQFRHDKCFNDEFFDINKNSCTAKVSNTNCQNITETSMKCSENDRELNYADHTDCRKYYQCNEAELISKKCRNGESFDNLLGFCRQNDGTCLIENGQRVGACAGKHGKFVEDSDNCLQYYTCINGQKISKSCKLGEYFDKSASRCEKDLNKTCSVLEDHVINETELSCDGLDDLVFYPNTLDGCKTFFQCVKSIPKVHKCPDDFLYDNEAGACNWKENVNCFNKLDHQQSKNIV